jgi:hypothetical protein
MNCSSNIQPLNGVTGETVKTVSTPAQAHTRLKPGANERLDLNVNERLDLKR